MCKKLKTYYFIQKKSYCDYRMSRNNKNFSYNPHFSLLGLDIKSATVHVVNGDIDLLDKYFGISSSDVINKLIDDYENNLLHIAVFYTTTKKVEMVKYLLEKGLNIDHKNKVGQTPYDLAILSHDKILIQLFSNVIKYTASTQLASEILILKTECATKDNIIYQLESTNSQLKTTVATKDKIIINMKTSSDKLKSNLMSQTDLTHEYKKEINSLREHNDSLLFTNKRLIDDNNELTTQNKKLRTSVDALIESKRKS